MTDGMKPSALAPKSRGLSPLAVLDAGSIGGAPAWQVSWSSDGALLASCHGAPDPCVRIWRREPAPAASADRPHEEQEQDLWSLVATLDQVHTRTVRSVAFSPSAGTPVLASASEVDSAEESRSTDRCGDAGPKHCSYSYFREILNNVDLAKT